MNLEGHLDDFDGYCAYGWAYDARRPDTPLVIEFYAASRKVGECLAEHYRADLQQYGNGRHGFRFRVPQVLDRKVDLIARISGSDFQLAGSPMRAQRQHAIEWIAGDIVNQCNLRCPFCMVDYSNIPPLKLMSREVYERVIELVAIMMPGGLWLSCLHEPTLHPQLASFMEAVPEAYRDRISFTTNLARRMNGDLLERIANSGAHEIRVSIDSRNPKTYSELRKKGKYEVFEKNLTALAAALKNSSKRPRLRLITMAFSDNYTEILDLVRFGRDLGADVCEVRYMNYEAHLAKWGKDHVLSLHEWAKLEAALAPLGVAIAPPAPDTVQKFKGAHEAEDYLSPETAFGGKESEAPKIPDPQRVGELLPDKALQLRLRWDGLIAASNESQANFGVNICQLEDPAAYFHAIRATAGSGLPKDFDPATYLALHSDVAKAGVDPEGHYRNYGRAEGRAYTKLA